MDKYFRSSDGCVDLRHVTSVTAIGNLRVEFTLREGNRVSMYGIFKEARNQWLAVAALEGERGE